MPCRRSHTLYRTDSRCRALSRNISHCLSAGTASDHLLDVFRSSAGCRRRPPAPGGKKGAGGSALPPGTAPELAAQGVYVNTPRRHAGLRRLQAACVQFGHDTHAALCRKAGRLVSRYPAGEESGSGKPPGRKPHIIPLYPCSARPGPAASPQHTARSRCIPAAHGQIPLHPRIALSRISPWGKFFA